MQVRLCIISNMASTERSVQMSIRLSEEESELRDKLAHHFGIDHAGVMRMALLKLAREEGITLNEKKTVPEGTARRKR